MPSTTPLPPDTADALNRINRNVERMRASIDYQLGGTCATLQNVLDEELNTVHANTDTLCSGLIDFAGPTTGRGTRNERPV